MPPKAPVEVVGGAKVEAVEQKSPVPEVEGDTVQVITTAPGTLGPGGIVPIGTKASVKVRHFSKNWMRPATAADAAKIKKD